MCLHKLEVWSLGVLQGAHTWGLRWWEWGTGRKEDGHLFSNTSSWSIPAVILISALGDATYPLDRKKHATTVVISPPGKRENTTTGHPQSSGAR